MNKYLLHGNLKAKQGHRDELAAILVEASELMATAQGCKLYAVGLDNTVENAVFVTEIWDSKDDHANSLKVAGVRELIMRAMPLLDGQPQKGQEIELLSAAGL